MFLFLTAQGQLHSAQGKASRCSSTFLWGFPANLFPIIIIVCQQGVCIVLHYLVDITAMVHFDEFLQLWSYKELRSCYIKITTKRFLFLKLTLTWTSHWQPVPHPPKRTSYIIVPLKAGCETAYENDRCWLFPSLAFADSFSSLLALLTENMSWSHFMFPPPSTANWLTVCSLLDGSSRCHWERLRSTKCLVLMLH